MEILATAARQEIKSIQIGREEIKFSLYTDDILCIHTHTHIYIYIHIYTFLKTPHTKLLELINEFSKIAGYKINIQKPIAFLYTKDEISEKKCKQSFLKHHKKYFGIISGRCKTYMMKTTIH